MFYKWLDNIIDLSDDELRNMALFRCPVDPRLKAFKIGAISIPNERLLRNCTDAIVEGHYMLYLYDEVVRDFVSCWPNLIPANFKRRSRSPSQTCTPSPSGTPNRNTGTRIAVRMRDKRCLITGQAAVRRSRGGNFTGLEVAHIFPLMGVGSGEWTRPLSVSARQLVITRQVADRPHNGILLRADVHSLFDDYQWSIWFEHGIARVVRFEKSGAMVLDDIDTTDLRPSNLDTTAPCSLALLQEHLRVALLIHVRGVGRRPVAGFTATLLV